jgi:hypothetical protein
MEIAGKIIVINPSTKLTTANLLYFRMGLICSEVSILPSNSLRRVRFAVCAVNASAYLDIFIARIASFAAPLFYAFEPPNGLASRSIPEGDSGSGGTGD